jgi:orotate phosphoribosyltransferase
MAVVVFQPYPGARSFDPLPFYYLTKLDAVYSESAATCDLCRRGVPFEKVQD